MRTYVNKCLIIIRMSWRTCARETNIDNTRCRNLVRTSRAQPQLLHVRGFGPCLQQAPNELPSLMKLIQQRCRVHLSQTRTRWSDTMRNTFDPGCLNMCRTDGLRNTSRYTLIVWRRTSQVYIHIEILHKINFKLYTFIAS